MTHSKMKGFLSFLILWIIRNQSMTGSEITKALEKRKGRVLSPGTIYPVLGRLKDDGLLSIDENKSYSLTKNGVKELKSRISIFQRMFHDLDEMIAYASQQ